MMNKIFFVPTCRQYVIIGRSSIIKWCFIGQNTIHSFSKAISSNVFMVLGAWFEWTLMYRDVATGGPGRSWSLHFNFQTKKVPIVSVSNIWEISFYGCLKVTQTRNFIVFTVYATVFEQFTVAFHFFLLHRGSRSDLFILELLKRSNSKLWAF